MTENRKIRILVVLLSTSAAVVTDGFKLGNQCRSNEHQCDGSKCLPHIWMCDGDPDCKDGSDEVAENCPEHILKARQEDCQVSTHFKCGTGECIPIRWKCDGAKDCNDNSDESECTALSCPSGDFMCKRTHQCITARWHCDGAPDCMDGSDEEDCEQKATTTVPEHMFRCTNGIVVPKKWVCDGESDCADGSDENGCQGEPEPTKRTCREGLFQCGSNCVPQSWVCDGTKDCLQGEDEADCTECFSHQIQCANRMQCISTHEKCNGIVNCADGSDEKDCPTVPPVPTAPCNLTTHYGCKSGQCIPRDHLCNDLNNCGDWEDESGEVCGENECNRNNGGCTQKCVDTREGHYCDCETGYRLIGKYTCEDINECVEIAGTCSQLCTNTEGGFHCSCSPGYQRDPGNYTRCKAAGSEPYILFSHRYDIRSLRLKDSEMTSIINNAKGATALDFSFKRHQIIWSNNKENEIVRANLTTPETQEVLVSGDRVSADGLAVDWIHNNIYFTDTSTFKIRMVSWDGKWKKTVIQDQVGQPRAIVVSPSDGYLFWSDWGSTPKIEHSGLDGSNRNAIVKFPHVYWPNGLTLDFSNNHIYWCDGRLNSISRAKFDGSHVERVLFDPHYLRHPYSLTVFEDRVYWTDWSQVAIYSADKFTGDNIHNISAGYLLESPKVVQIFHEYRQAESENVCENYRCSHFCVKNLAGEPTCVCPDGLVLSSLNKRECVLFDPATRGGGFLPLPGYLPDTSPVEPMDPEKIADFIATKAEQLSREDKPHVGMILGAALGGTVVLALALVFSMYMWKSRQGEVKRIIFQNPVYKKTTDNTVAGEDGGGLVIAHQSMLYNPSNFHYNEAPEDFTTSRDDDCAQLVSKK